MNIIKLRGTGHVPSPLGAPIQQGSEGNLCQPRPGRASQRQDSLSRDRSGSIWNSHDFYAQFLSKTFKCFVLFLYAIFRLQVTASFKSLTLKFPFIQQLRMCSILWLCYWGQGSKICSWFSVRMPLWGRNRTFELEGLKGSKHWPGSSHLREILRVM
jgi:hypothetical protein